MFKPKDDTAAIMRAIRRSDKGAFLNAVKELNQKGGGTVDVLRRATMAVQPGEVDSFTIQEVAEDPNFFQSMKKKHKDGIYTFNLSDLQKKQVGQHHFALGDISAKRTATKDDNGKDRKSDNFKDELILRMMDKMMDREANNGLGSVKDLAEVIASIATIFQGSGGGGGSEVIGAFMDGFQLRGEVQPQLEQQEPTMQLLQSFIPLIGQIAANRSGGNQRFTPEQLTEIQNLRGQIERLTGTSTPGPVQTEHPPPPGVSTGGAGGSVMSGVGSSPGPTASPSDPIARFNDRFITPFRADAAAGASDDELAYQIVSMAQYARDRMAVKPPIVADFLTARGLQQYQDALGKFFAAIPELSSLTQRQVAIQAALMKMFVTTQTAQEVPPVQAEEVAEQEEVVEAEVVESTGNVDQTLDESKEHADHTLEVLHVQDADRELVGDADTQEGTTVEDQPDSEEDRPRVGDEAVRSEV